MGNSDFSISGANKTSSKIDFVSALSTDITPMSRHFLLWLLGYWIMSSLYLEITVILPANLLFAVDALVNQGKAESLNEFIAQAIKHELASLKRAEIDEALAEMTQQPDYQQEVLQMDREFANASWEALRLNE